MDDLSEKLADILNDPESMQRVRAMAENLLGGSEQKAPPEPDLNSVLGDGGLDGAQIAKIMGIMSRLKNTGRDSRTDLLLALKPHLSAPRREKVDTAIKLLKIIDILPLLKESGMFEF